MLDMSSRHLYCGTQHPHICLSDHMLGSALHIRNSCPSTPDTFTQTFTARQKDHPAHQFICMAQSVHVTNSKPHAVRCTSVSVAVQYTVIDVSAYACCLTSIIHPTKDHCCVVCQPKAGKSHTHKPVQTSQTQLACAATSVSADRHHRSESRQRSHPPPPQIGDNLQCRTSWVASSM